MQRKKYIVGFYKKITELVAAYNRQVFLGKRIVRITHFVGTLKLLHDDAVAVITQRFVSNFFLFPTQTRYSRSARFLFRIIVFEIIMVKIVIKRCY